MSCWRGIASIWQILHDARMNFLITLVLLAVYLLIGSPWIYFDVR